MDLIIDAEQLKKRLQDPQMIVVDTRSYLAEPELGRSEYIESHIPGAIYLHLNQDLSGEIIKGKTGRHPLPTQTKMNQLFSSIGVDANKQIVVYDQSHGGIAARLWWMLTWQGHCNVSVLNGGWSRWTQLEFPTASDITVPTSSEFVGAPSPDWLLDYEEVQSISKDRSRLLVDARAPKRYQGIEEPIDPIAGHIPGAINKPFHENLNSDGLWLSKEKITQAYQAYFEDSNNAKPIFYCGSGVTACHDILSCTYAGLLGAVLYPGSWSEWIVKAR